MEMPFLLFFDIPPASYNRSFLLPAPISHCSNSILNISLPRFKRILTADSLIFFPVAFGGIIAWKELLIMMGIQIVLKSLYEVMILPVTIRVVKAIKKIDGSDVYDTDISYNVLKVKDI